MTVSLDLSDVQRWGGLLADEAEAIHDRLVGAVAAEQAAIFTRARNVAPYRSGDLKGSIRPTGRGLTRRVKAGTKRIYYPLFVEFGTKEHGAAQPFLLVQADAAAHAEFEGRVNRALAQGEPYR